MSNNLQYNEIPKFFGVNLIGVLDANRRPDHKKKR